MSATILKICLKILSCRGFTINVFKTQRYATLLCNYLGEKGLHSSEAGLAGAVTGLLDCPGCPAFREFRGTRPGRVDFFNETGLSCSNKKNQQSHKIRRSPLLTCPAGHTTEFPCAPVASVMMWLHGSSSMPHLAK